ncbi:transposable element Tcb1 transposase [Trichonephila clavipes]|nr:transposable element Tcb1 transposase [Trichonephila clavipes]
METIPNHTDSCPKARRGSPKSYNPSGRSIYCYCSQAESQSDSTRVTSMVTASIGKAITAATVCLRLHMNGLYARVLRVCVPLSFQSRGARLKWCREHDNWTVSDWGNVMFTDESKFALEPDYKCIMIWRKQGGRDFIRIPHGPTHPKRGSVTTVWYQDEVLEPIVRLYAAAVGSTFILIDASARPHRADIVHDYLESELIARMAWPTYSPDLNPIENLWDDLGRTVSSRFLPPATLIELETALQEEWRLLNLRWLTT